MDGNVSIFGDAERLAPGKVKPIRKLKSPHWQHFTIKTLEDGSLRAFCKYCTKSLTCGPKAGTSHIARHARNCRKLLTSSGGSDGPSHVPRPMKNREKLQWKRKTQKPLPIVPSFCGSISGGNFVLDESVCRLELAKMFILHELPFKIVEHEGFRRFRDAIAGDCKTLYEMGKMDLKEALKSCERISLATSMWTSDQNLGYMCLTAHYIDDGWRIHKKMLTFCVVKTPHDGITKAGIVAKSLAQWDIDRKISSITCDNSSLNDAMYDSVKANLLENKALPPIGHLYHVRCCAHILNEIVRYALEVLHDVVGNIRERVRYVKSAASREEIFDEAVGQMGLPKKKSLSLDVAGRWDTTYLMLDSAIYYKKVFLVLGQWDNEYTLASTAEEWKEAEFLCKFLKICYNAANVLSTTRGSTSNMCLHEICAIHNFLHQEIDFSETTVHDMLRVMQAKFDEYWGESTLLYAISTVLDPRFKMLFLKYAFEQIYGLDYAPYVDEVSRTIYAIFYEYKDQSAQSEANKHGHESKEGETGEDEDMNEETEVFVGYNQFLSQQSLKEAKSDLDRYLGESVVPLNQKSFDVLKWWHDNSLVYPVLSKMARTYLSIPASTVLSEAAFSTSGTGLDRFRSRLSPDVIEALVCSQDWLRDEYTEGGFLLLLLLLPLLPLTISFLAVPDDPPAL
ncbi:unnamed protein product [Spirodela intermedia]|uniref:BED-type domain-containing protein n=1 Tax=Spirodela intermedia TaxID=51605 RepID=A0A7I8IWG3_SPIIN|nr:unnamed protein product [Spirodela intermedia]CAA6662318.1 unnamed protein product [Spirodela intermedia]